MYNELKYVSSKVQSNNTDCKINDNIMIIIIIMMISNGEDRVESNSVCNHTSSD